MIRLPFVPRSTADMIERRRVSEVSILSDQAADLRRQLEDANARHDALLEKYYAAVGKPTAQITGVAAESPSDILGPKTRGTLRALGIGQSRQVRDAMTARAIEMALAEHNDEDIMSALRRGEIVSLTSRQRASDVKEAQPA